MSDTTKLSAKEIVVTLIVSSILYSILLCVFVHFLAPKKFEDCPKCVEALSNYRARQRAKQIALEKKYGEIEPEDSGYINPILLQKTAGEQATQAPQERAYQQQLAEYRLQMARERQKQLELQRAREAEQAKRAALMEKEKQEYLRQQELAKQSASSATTVNRPSTTSKTAVQKNAQKPTQQKTQIGTLKKSQLGRTSFK